MRSAGQTRSGTRSVYKLFCRLSQVYSERVASKRSANGALTSRVRLRKRRAKVTGFRNRLHIFDSCNGRIATEREQYARNL
jgi:hypothetical protein